MKDYMVFSLYLKAFQTRIFFLAQYFQVYFIYFRIFHPGYKKYSGYIEMKTVIQEQIMTTRWQFYLTLWKTLPQRSISSLHTFLLDLG